MVNIVFEEIENRSAAYDNENLIGECTFTTYKDNVWIIDHTFVDSSYRGQNIAGNLVKEIVDHARKENKKILPLCPFAKSEFENKEEYHDIWFK